MIVESVEYKDEGDIIDQEVFSQILEMDDEGHEFLYKLIMNYFQQVESTFENIRICLGKGDLQTISQLGHSLKGSSASMGLIKMRESSERLRKIGKYKEEVDSSISKQYLLRAAALELECTETEFKRVEDMFINFLENSTIPPNN
ncbi:hypothetical protein BB559_004941 [Furculomyces boomerangus]|uniref:HPt domain-containing protein n=2 Tax=Harpellales TaxID=61421 RepID=A0A2T9YBS9_9FUNG|nr:hypothetical protein BB559_006525 [Furculomyces boomerangus]PVU89797.1 hypothetical protein BB559_004941 [Furculomyces boomerangus]PVZ96951.1 hypothetical protein BB558_007114 [Smittium angustum]